jgi:hypothetical protein
MVDKQMVDNEINGSFVAQQFLDPKHDRVLDELLGRPIADGLALGDRQAARTRLAERTGSSDQNW